MNKNLAAWPFPIYDKEEPVVKKNKILKRIYKEAKAEAKAQGIKFMQHTLSEYADPDADYIGFTVAYMPSLKSNKCKMLKVAVSYCSDSDKFKKKKGKYEAYLKLIDGEYVQIPLTKFSKDHPELAEEILKEAFLV